MILISENNMNNDLFQVSRDTNQSFTELADMVCILVGSKYDSNTTFSAIKTICTRVKTVEGLAQGLGVKEVNPSVLELIRLAALVYDKSDTPQKNKMAELLGGPFQFAAARVLLEKSLPYRASM